MNLHSPASRRSCVLVFVGLFAVALAWSLYTQHAWEDFYITYRASKNLATGHGLTFTAGERVHSFTSPIGVLLPALASLLTGNRSDVAALWIFRSMSIAALAGAAVFLWQLATRVFSRRLSALLAVAFVAFDTKIVDFTTNGMETGFLLLFLAWTLYALVASPRHQRIQLGMAWAGLMWTRPDSFVYIAALGVAVWLFPPRNELGVRKALLKTYLSAGAITAVLYGPWLIWAYLYYGSAVPHTIVAKGLFHEPATPAFLWRALVSFPKKIVEHPDILATTFMPPYSYNTGWPRVALLTSFWLSLPLMLAWLVPGVRREARITSFTFFIGEFYLTSFVGFPVPWYIPTLTAFALVTLVALVDQVSTVKSWNGILSPVGFGLASTLLVGSLAIFTASAYQLRWQQRLIELGQRREIGLWLKSQAKSATETVFLEPLGYIGFYSGLKMLDYPGLSSPEVVAARRHVGVATYPDCWPQLVLQLLPTWIVARSYEVEAFQRASPETFARFYRQVRVFDVSAAINAVPHLPGRGYLLNDAHFEVFRRTENLGLKDAPMLKLSTVGSKQLDVNECWGRPAYDDGPTLLAHAPSRLVFKKPMGARFLLGGFGIFDGAYANPQNSTDGAEFSVTFVDDNGSRRELLHRLLRPRDVNDDRGTKSFSVELPADTSGSIELRTSPGPANQNAFDWTYWSSLFFEIPVGK